MRDAAQRYLAAGLCVLPARRDHKRPTVSWKPFQYRLPTEAEVDAWLANEQTGLCILTGKVSGNHELIDFDQGGARFSAWCDKVRAARPGILERLAISRTQRDGRHVAYRAECEISGNLKLAQRQGDDGKVVTLIETRGEGGLYLCAPTPGYEVLQGDLCNLPVLTAEERDILLQCAWDLNEYVPPVVDGPNGTPKDATPVARSQQGPTSGHGEPLGGLRPGDDYNLRGDVRSVLRERGWQCTRGGTNEHWRRPDKTSGSNSATFNGEHFYVFSSNAGPFEPNHAYSPFAVYALLKHGGNWEKAARQLRLEGYGSDVPPDAGVDLSAIVSQATPEPPDRGPVVADPGAIPERLFQVPGLVAEVMEFTLANAPYPNVGLAFCGAIALMSYLTGRKVRTSTDLRPNIDLLALAGSGVGKDFPRKVNSRVLFEIGHLAALGDKFASGQGIQVALLRSPAMLFQNDEMDGVLRQINADRDNKQESIPNILLTVNTSANDVYPVRVKAGQKEMSHIDQPHLTLFGTATPQYFYESLSQRMLTNGLFARMIIVDTDHRGQGRLPGSVRSMPAGIIDQARWWGEFQPGRRSGNLYEVHPEPVVVPFTPDAEQALTALQRMAEDEWDKATAAKDEPARTAWSRTCENATKLALIYACSESREQPAIDLPAVEWATAFAMHQTRRQLFLAQSYVAENPFHAECLKLLRKLREAEGGQMARNRLMRAMRCKLTDFDQIVGTLLTQGDIVAVEIPSRTKTAQGYRSA